jgi:hypothetical protein
VACIDSFFRRAACAIFFNYSISIIQLFFMAAQVPQGWIVPKIQHAVCSLPFIQSSPMIKGLLEHPAGPFTSEYLEQ